MRTGMQRLKPVEIMLGVYRDRRVLAGERRVADDRIEAWIDAIEDLRKFERPMERHDRRRVASQLLDCGSEPILPPGPRLLDDRADAQPRLLLAGARFVSREKRRDHRVADESWVGESLLGAGENQPLLLFWRIFERGADVLALAPSILPASACASASTVPPAAAALSSRVVSAATSSSLSRFFLSAARTPSRASISTMTPAP
jgi:hypothetical protein